MILNPYEIREDFPILKRKINNYPLIYFDNAATSQKPKQVIDVIKDFYENHNANVHRAVLPFPKKHLNFMRMRTRKLPNS